MEVTIGDHLDVQSAEAYIEQWLQAKKATGTSSGTLSRYGPVLQRFLESLPEKRRRVSIASITALEVEPFRNTELEAGKTPGTANFAVKVLRAVFKTARRRGLCPINPAEAVEMLPEVSEERLPFLEDQVKDLIAVAENEWRGMILLGYHTGIRSSDAANLTWANVDLLNRILVFRARKTAGRTKAAQKDSVVYMHADLVSYFASLPASDDTHAPIFPGLYRKTPGSHGGLSNGFGRLMHLAGIRAPLGPEKRGKGRQFKALGFHSLRHSFRSWVTSSRSSS